MKIQLGLCYVIEMFVGDESPRPDGGASAVGYALFDLQHRQITQVFAFFGDVLSAAQAMALV